MSKIKALEMAENPSIYWKEGKKKRHPKAAFAFEMCLSYLFVFLLCAGSVLVYDSIFPIESPVHILFLCIGIVEVLLFFVYLFPALKRFAPLLTACGFLVGFLFLRDPIASGLKQCANEVIRKFNAHFGTEIFVFQEVEETVRKQTAIYFIALLFLWWFVESLLHLKNVALLSIPPLCLICGELLVGKAPDEWPLLMVAGSFFVLLSFGNGRHIKAESGIAGIRGKAVIFLAAAILLSLFLTDRYGRGKAEELVKLQNEVLSYQFALERQIVEHAPGGILGKSAGRISNKAPEYEGKEVLSVTTNRFPSGNIYLRGYVGDTYRNGNWTNKSQMEFEDVISEQLAYANKVAAGSYILNLFYKSQLTHLIRYRSKYQITYWNTKEDYAYLPYMADLEHISKDGRIVSPLLIDADAMIYREGADSLYVDVISPNDLFREVQKGLDYTGNAAIENCYNAYLAQYLRVPLGLSGINELGRELTQKLNRNYRRVEGIGNLVATREIYAACLVRDELFARASYSLELDRLPFGEDVVEYFLFESQKGFCEHYASAGVLLLRQMGIPARYVSGYMVRPQDFVRVDSTGENANTEYTAVVKDDAAHAWVEVFVGQVGWVPIEMTEGSAYETAGSEKYNAEYYESLWQNGDHSNAGFESDVKENMWEDIPESTPESEQEIPEETESVGESEAQAEKDGSEAEDPRQPDVAAGTDPKETDGDSEKETALSRKEAFAENVETSSSQKMKRIWPVIFLCSLFLVGGTTLLSYTKLRHRQTETFLQKENRKAIVEITARINRLLRKKGILRSKELDDAGYRETLGKGLPMIPKEELSAYFLVLERAAYSNEILDKKDVLCCYRIYQRIKKKHL